MSNFPARPSPRRPRRPAFTLVELLVVIGIIALLMSILLPALNRAREAGMRTQCLSNVRQIGTAFMMYVNANKGFFPRSAGAAHRPEDFLHWQSGRNINDSAIAPYIGQPLPLDLFRCPGDTEFSVRNYKFSYSMNMKMSDVSNIPPKLVRISRVKNPAEKVLLYEEDPVTIDDGNGDLVPGSNIDLLAIRHDRLRKMPDNVTTGLTENGERRGNALFCDGHGDYVSRKFVHDKKRYDPQEP